MVWNGYCVAIPNSEGKKKIRQFCYQEWLVLLLLSNTFFFCLEVAPLGTQGLLLAYSWCLGIILDKTQGRTHGIEPVAAYKASAFQTVLLIWPLKY